jgi:cobalt-zinc-cadmium efflux system protein
MWSGSLALIGDAGHMLSDSFALGLAAFAAWLSHKPASTRHTYGLVRAEVIAAFVNGLLMVALIVTIAVEAVQRLLHPQPVAGGAVMVIAFVGLLVNILVAFILSRGERSLNTRAALLHVIGDLLGSVATLVSGAVIYFTNWTPVDPLLSIGLAGLILYSTVRLLKETLHVLMEGVPPEVDVALVGSRLAALEGVRSVHDLHVWRVSGGTIALSAHLLLDDIVQWPAVLHEARKRLHDDFDIEHVTLQPEVLMEREDASPIPIYPI